jgi:hypothetical protein
VCQISYLQRLGSYVNVCQSHTSLLHTLQAKKFYQFGITGSVHSGKGKYISLGATTLSIMSSTIATFSMTVKNHDNTQNPVSLCSAVILYFYAGCRYAKRHYAEGRYAECHYVERRYAECQ